MGAALSAKDLYAVEAVMLAEDLVVLLEKKGVKATVVGSLNEPAFDMSALPFTFEEGSDVDIAVSPEDFDKAKEVIREFSGVIPAPSADYYVGINSVSERKYHNVSGQFTVHLIGSLGDSKFKEE